MRSGWVEVEQALGVGVCPAEPPGIYAPEGACPSREVMVLSDSRPPVLSVSCDLIEAIEGHEGPS